jgi:hypothetical protein
MKYFQQLLIFGCLLSGVAAHAEAIVCQITSNASSFTSVREIVYEGSSSTSDYLATVDSAPHAQFPATKLVVVNGNDGRRTLLLPNVQALKGQRMPEQFHVQLDGELGRNRIVSGDLYVIRGDLVPGAANPQIMMQGQATVECQLR